jgi:hypothetical protein
MKIMPRRPSKREANRARKLSMTDFELCHHATPPHPKRNHRRASCFDPPGTAARGVVFRMRSNSMVEVGEKDPFREMTEAMMARGIKLLALDFDQTLVSCHTRSQWYGTAEELARHVRPTMRKLIVAAVETGMRIAIVSFSGQCEMVRNAMIHAVPTVDTTAFAISCSDKQWNVPEMQLRHFFPRLPHGILRVDALCKLPHLCFAVQQLTKMEPTLTIAPHNILLLDDDEKNVRSAEEMGMTAVQIVPEEPEAFLTILGDLYLQQHPHAEQHHHAEHLKQLQLNHPPVNCQQQHHTEHHTAFAPSLSAIASSVAGSSTPSMPMPMMAAPGLGGITSSSTATMRMPMIAASSLGATTSSSTPTIPTPMLIAPSLSTIAHSVSGSSSSQAMPLPVMVPPSLSSNASSAAILRTPSIPLMMRAPSLNSIAASVALSLNPLELMPEVLQPEHFD